MGRVWRGHDDVLDRPVAVKQILLHGGLTDDQRHELTQRLLREARATARLTHSGIVTVHDVVAHEGAPAIVMEFLAGPSLGSLIEQEGRLSVERVAEIGAAILDALREAHTAGIVHRDLKPDNVLLAGRRTIITDFGIASIADATRMTFTGSILGTPAFMAPEQIEGQDATELWDLWSLGVTLYQAVEGVTPFTGPTMASLFNAILTREPRPAEHAGPLTEVLAGLLVKDPAGRATAEKTTEALEAISRPAPRPPVIRAHPVCQYRRAASPPQHRPQTTPTPASWKATPTPSVRWRSARTAPLWPPRATTRRCGCGTLPRAARSENYSATQALWEQWLSARTAEPWPPPMAVGKRGCGM
ncbi:serine/threonine protein kinase, partial [Actinomadura bangladeshensis]